MTPSFYSDLRLYPEESVEHRVGFLQTLIAMLVMFAIKVISELFVLAILFLYLTLKMLRCSTKRLKVIHDIR